MWVDSCVVRYYDIHWTFISLRGTLNGAQCGKVVSRVGPTHLWWVSTTSSGSTSMLLLPRDARSWESVYDRSFDGYSNANYALSEVRDPVRTMKRAAPLAVFSVTFIYMLVNVAYYAVVDKEEILGSGRIAAALFFGKLWGMWTERVWFLSKYYAWANIPTNWESLNPAQVVSLLIAISALGSVLSILFAQGRGQLIILRSAILNMASIIYMLVIQELGREGVLPFSAFFASNKPFNTPLPGLFSQWVTTSLVIIMIPPGDAYLFCLNCEFLFRNLLPVINYTRNS